ncbi:MAG: branched-chain amino acid ABC transporter permease [Deltaproteobacteria bacterium]|nr:MAG: branched-chain amino acid ABC transporter permease [Deltaproteobacteria bacterium]
MIDLLGLIETTVNGLLIGGVYGLAALGLSLIWGVMKVVNLAHGVFIMLGAYLGYGIFYVLGLHPLFAMFLAIPIGVGVGIVLYRYLINRILEVATNELEQEMMCLLFTFGLSMMIYGAALNIWGSDLRGVPTLMPTIFLGDIAIPSSRFIAFMSALVLGGLLYFFLKKTFIGKAIRAVTQNRNYVMLDGIDPVKIFQFSFSIGLTYALMAGVVISLTYPVTPIMGVYYLLKCFTVVVLGGLGNPFGAFLGGLILGLAESYTSLFATYALSPAVAFITLLLILIFRPGGILGTLR